MLNNVIGHNTKKAFFTGRERRPNLAIKDINGTNIDSSTGTQGYASVVSEMRWSSDEVKLIEATVLAQVKDLKTSRSTARRGKRSNRVFTQSSSFGHPDTLHRVSAT